MRLQPIDSFLLTRIGLMEYFLFAFRPGRHRVKPGVTELARINGFRGETDPVEQIVKRLEFDLVFIKNGSLWFDLYLLLRTVAPVLFSREAY